MQYPHEKEAPPIRVRGVIALREDNCTSCMLCARSCPDWCIYIEAHKEWRRRAVPVAHLGRSTSSIASTSTTRCACTADLRRGLPFDALFWSPEYEYSEPKIADLLHDKAKLGEWMETVPEAPELEVGADKKGKK